MNLLDYCYRYPKPSYNPGEVILREGSRTGLLFVLVDGVVEIEKQGVVLNRVSTPGAIFGEISSLLDAAHMATVRALTPCRFYVIEEAREFIRSHPDVGLLVAGLLAQRLSSVTNHLTTVTRSLETLMKRETTAKKGREEVYVEKPMIGVMNVGPSQRISLTV